jgi:hypothetical protein
MYNFLGGLQFYASGTCFPLYFQWLIKAHVSINYYKKIGYAGALSFIDNQGI